MYTAHTIFSLLHSIYDWEYIYNVDCLVPNTFQVGESHENQGKKPHLASQMEDELHELPCSHCNRNDLGNFSEVHGR